MRHQDTSLRILALALMAPLLVATAPLQGGCAAEVATPGEPAAEEDKFAATATGMSVGAAIAILVFAGVVHYTYEETVGGRFYTRSGQWAVQQLVNAANGIMERVGAVATTFSQARTHLDDHRADQASAGAALREDHCPANSPEEAATECWLYFHYSNEARFTQSMSSGVISPNARNQVYLTWLPYTSSEAEDALFIGNPRYRGRGDYVIAFRKTHGVVFNRGTQWNELIHYGGLRMGSHIEVVYAGPNPF